MKTSTTSPHPTSNPILESEPIPTDFNKCRLGPNFLPLGIFSLGLYSQQKLRVNQTQPQERNRANQRREKQGKGNKLTAKETKPWLCEPVKELEALGIHTSQILEEKDKLLATRLHSAYIYPELKVPIFLWLLDFTVPAVKAFLLKDGTVLLAQ